MDRRGFVTALLATAALPLGVSALGAAAQTGGEPVNVVERFGFVADGRTDNYEAFHRWAAHVNRERGGHYLFPPGTYAVRKVRTLFHELRKPGAIVNPRIDRADGLTISGYGAKIRLNGAFHRSARMGPDGVQVGRHAAIFMPFEIHRSRNVTIRGFEMDGGVREMSRDTNVLETYAFLVALHGCTDVLLEDLDLHHCQTDGVYLASSFLGGRPSLANRDVILRRVNSHHNARGGLGAMHVYGLLCEDCRFNHNGGPGKYRPHLPQYGVDIEPDYVLPDVDILTGNIEFRRCEFLNNLSALLAAYGDRFRGYLRLIDCRTSNDALAGPYHMILAWPGALIQGGRYDAGAGAIYTSWQNQSGGETTIRDCEIRTSGLYGLMHYFDGNRLHLEGVRVVGGHREPGSHGEMVLVRANPGRGRKNLVRNCDMFVPAARKSRRQAFDYEIVLNHTVSEGNLFRTDLAASGDQHFAVNYDAGGEARGDRFRGTAPGTRDSIRPGHNSRHDTRTPYSSG